MSEIINETINELNKPTQNNVFSIEDDPVTVLEKINQVERYLKQIDTHVDTSINTANEALEKANNAFEANGTLVKINGENQLTWSADFAESERQKSKNLYKSNFWNKSSNIYEVNGVTFTYNPNDYSITINGTATSRALCYLNPDALANIKIGTYTFSGFDKKTSYSVYIQAVNEAEGNYPALLYSDSDFRTVTFNIMPKLTDLYISVDAGIVVDNLVLKFQAEEGSVATDYQPYNGAIVHEKEIADVEHIALIYDMSSSDANINQGKTSGVQFNSSNANYVGNATTSTSKYKYFYVYIKIVNQIVCVKMKTGVSTSIMAQNYTDNFGTLTMGILLNSYDAIYAHDIRSIMLPSGSFTTHYDNSDYVITKVEGVLL